jgi:uncharacterized protein (TIGR03000 family)
MVQKSFIVIALTSAAFVASVNTCDAFYPRVRISCQPAYYQRVYYGPIYYRPAYSQPSCCQPCCVSAGSVPVSGNLASSSSSAEPATGAAAGANGATSAGNSEADDKMLKEITDFLEYKGQELEEFKEAWKNMDAPARKKLHDSIQLPAEETATTAQFVVTLPADASLTINGYKTISTSEHRVFESQRLPSGDHAFTFVAEIVRNGQTLRLSRTIQSRAGQVTQLDLAFPNSMTVASR